VNLVDSVLGRVDPTHLPALAQAEYDRLTLSGSVTITNIDSEWVEAVYAWLAESKEDEHGPEAT